MKKGIIILGCFLLLTGCTSKKEERLNAMEHYGKDYYKEYGSSYDVDEYTVSLKNLKDANKMDKQNYDLKMFQKCEETTNIVFEIKNKKIKSFKIKLNC